jgi:hypothetical protein
MNIQVRKRSGESDTVVPYNTKQPLAKKLYNLWDTPNPLQSRGEFLQQAKIFLEVSGNAFIRGNCGSSFSAQNMLTMFNVWPQHMQYIRANSYFDALTIEDIIKEWRFKAGEYERRWTPQEVMFTSKANTEIQDDVIFGRSPMVSLRQPISNIDGAYIARNVMMKNRGMRLVFASNAGDATGKIPLQTEEIDILRKSWNEYGMGEGQQQAFFSPYPVTITPIDQNVEKLGLFKEVANDALVVCHGYGVPDVLLKCYIEGTTYENQESSLRRLYQGTLIPEAEEFFNSVNKWLGLHDSEYYLYPDFSHVPCLQDSEEKKEETRKIKSERLISELNAQLLTPDEYRAQMGYAPLPKKPEAEDGAIPDSEQDQKTLEAQAELRGSVGGVQGILNLQASVSAGTTTYEAGIGILTIVYGFSEENAKTLLGEPKPVETAEEETETTDTLPAEDDEDDAAEEEQDDNEEEQDDNETEDE